MSTNILIFPCVSRVGHYSHTVFELNSWFIVASKAVSDYLNQLPDDWPVITYNI